MTAWEYGYIYVVHTVGPAPAACIFVDSTRSRLLDGCHGLLRAANAVGTQGWIVSGQGERAACPPWVNDMIAPIERALKGDYMMCYFARRPSERAPGQ